MTGYSEEYMEVKTNFGVNHQPIQKQWFCNSNKKDNWNIKLSHQMIK